MGHGRAEPEHLSGTEALMWRMGRDPVLGSSFANVMVLDSPPDHGVVRARLEQTAISFPRLRARVDSPAFTPPMWVEDPSFDIDYHFRRFALAGRGTLRQLLDIAAVWAQDPLDPNRPLWQVVQVEGLGGDRAALLAKLHHAVTDGLGGLLLAASLFDADKDEPAGGGSTGRGSAGGGSADGGSADGADGRQDAGAGTGAAPGRADTAPSSQAARGGGPVDAPGGTGRQPGLSEAVDDVLRRLDKLQRAARETAALVGTTASKAARLATTPSSIEREASLAAGTARSLARQAFVSGQSKSPLWSGRTSPWRRIETLDVSLARAKRCARALSGTVNDVFVTGVAGGAADYHRLRGAEIDELRMSMPVHLRSGGSRATGNAFTPARVVLPVGIRDPRERFAAVRSRLAEARAEPALGLADRLAGALVTIPDPLLARLARQQVETVDFAASNLFGTPKTAAIAGSVMLADYPIGPTMGVAFNATVISYRSRLFMGVNVDTGAVDEPGLLRDCIAGSFRDLLRAVGRN